MFALKAEGEGHFKNARRNDFTRLTRFLQDISRQVVENDHVSLDNIKKCLTNLKMQRPTQNVNQSGETRPCTSQASAPGSDALTNEDYCPSIDESIDFTSDNSTLTSIESSST
jgi:hypothetical protein